MLELTWDYYFLAHGRDSWNAEGGTFAAFADADTLMPADDPLNAAWCWGCVPQRVAFGSSTACPEVILHESTHGVTADEGWLSDEPPLRTRELGEATSDAMAQLALAELSPGEDDWVQGGEIGCPMEYRDLADPGGLCERSTGIHHQNPSSWSDYSVG